MALKEKIQRILQDEFRDDPGYDLELEESAGGDVSGILTLQMFEGLETYQRQDRLWDVLDKHFDDDERAAIALIVTNTPEESSASRAQQRHDRRGSA